MGPSICEKIVASRRAHASECSPELLHDFEYSPELLHASECSPELLHIFEYSQELSVSLPLQ